MIRSAALLTIVALISAGHARANEEPCTPQPQCRVLRTPLIPGAPTTGMRQQRTISEKSEDKILDKAGADIKRDTFRLPSPK
jgi:hypothetical protein